MLKVLDTAPQYNDDESLNVEMIRNADFHNGMKFKSKTRLCKTIHAIANRQTFGSIAIYVPSPQDNVQLLKDICG